jgi:DNA-binding NtrC family response regulator
MARSLHYLSRRSGGPFVPVNCGAIPTELVENELFGHERGAYTGAGGPKAGLVAEAEGGTLFLDEVHDLPPLAQTKLLRLLQEREYRRLGCPKTRTADIRIVAAANRDPRECVRRGQLREDLYYRLNVVELQIPPLRDRQQDIPLLAAHFIGQYAAAFDRPAQALSSRALECLHARAWPGNVRELEHAIERAVILSRDSIIKEDLVAEGDSGISPPCMGSFNRAKAKFVVQFEREYIERILLAHEGNISSAARAANKHRRAFWELMRKHGIDAARFKTS